MKALPNELKQSFAQAATQYQSDLLADTYAQAYLARRGISRDVAVGFRLGSVRHPIPGDERFTGRLAIPYVTDEGVVNFTFRCMEQHDCKRQGEWHRKYLRPENVNTNLYNVPDLDTDEDFLCIAEGEIDAMTLSACGLPAVGVPGVANWKNHFNLLLEDFTHLYLFADGDESGYKLGKFLAKEVRVHVVKMDPGQDVNGIYVSEGISGIHQRFQAARPEYRPLRIDGPERNAGDEDPRGLASAAA